ncbi:MAG: sn-glycerol-3-phosphate ABC transporter ATP-binding protein UgpC [Peptoniphilaceae bacterium]|nr:sn-glycerol-3-phosphate ABC transporter ATP-binding protein UgpC [Peptoniphilaceae bacterium]MDY6018757.1 sn-glycerol-3-phosphate ABC transporter ATP-binding protein UgpC [Anaerococcus sp.]
MANLSFRHIYKIYDGKVTAVKDFNLEIEDKEFVVFVGPSGCGKSTTLRMVAGLEEISKGELYIGDKLVNNVEPKDRDIAMVFQNYALYPQMTVRENMSYALKIAKTPKDEIDRKVEEAAEILGIKDLLERKPKALSGGQRQRVALGRCIVRKPKVFLMDEPLSNLDAKLRVQTRSEITKLHERLETTFIYVTHDQIEAMTMADKIVIMDGGEIQQIDTPQNVYFHPKNIFVAGFIGSPQINFIDVKFIKENDNYFGLIEADKIPIVEKQAKVLEEKGYLNKDIVLGIRPEHIYDQTRQTPIKIEGVVSFTETLGSEQYIYFDFDKKELLSRVTNGNFAARGDKLNFYIDPDKMHFFDKETTENILF